MLEQVDSPLILLDQMCAPPGACEGKDPHVFRVVVVQRARLHGTSDNTVIASSSNPTTSDGSARICLG